MKISSGFNFYFDITQKCNGNCRFCIAHSIDRTDGPLFENGLKWAINFTQAIDGTIQIMGGEPTISHRLPIVLNELKNIKTRRIVLNTNGSNLSQKIIDQLSESKITHVNISRHHYNDYRNQNIMRLTPFLPHFKISQAISKLDKVGIASRMQCNIIKGQIDSIEEIIKYIEWCHDVLKCDNISFSQTFPLSSFDYLTPQYPDYSEKIQVNLKTLVQNIIISNQFTDLIKKEEDLLILRPNASFWGSSNWMGGGKRRFWHGPKNTLVSLKVLSGYGIDGLPINTPYNKNDDWELLDNIFAFAVLHPDGLITASWDRRERILFDPYADIKYKKIA